MKTNKSLATWSVSVLLGVVLLAGCSKKETAEEQPAAPAAATTAIGGSCKRALIPNFGRCSTGDAGDRMTAAGYISGAIPDHIRAILRPIRSANTLSYCQSKVECATRRHVMQKQDWVTPSKTGIQGSKASAVTLDPRFRGGDA